MALESPPMSQSKKLQSKSVPFAVFHVDSAVHDGTSGYDPLLVSSVSASHWLSVVVA